MTIVNRIAVLGAGTMGARIAAHFANAGVPALLLDLPSADSGDRSAIARRGLNAASKGSPAAFFTLHAMHLVECGNFEDDLARLADCDWVLEAVVENLAVKRDLWARAAAHCRSDAILTTNTSGIPLREIASALPLHAQSRFLGAHFFNPPRYLHLLEVIPGPQSAPELLDFVSTWADLRLGKGAVRCKDTPNFIANRLGCFFGAIIRRAIFHEPSGCSCQTAK